MGRKWDDAEDNLLRKLVAQHGKQWSLIASKIPNRTASQVSSRWEKCIDPALTKGPFSPEEDAAIIEYVNKNGPTSWPRLAEILHQRSPKQCRERWFNHLDPSLSKESWTNDEDIIIFEHYQVLGPKWSTIAKYLRHRSDNSIKNRWNSSISKRIKVDANGRKILVEEPSKKNHKVKNRHKPALQPLPIPPGPTANRLNIEVTQNGARQQDQYLQMPPMINYPGYPPGLQPMPIPQQAQSMLQIPQFISQPQIPKQLGTPLQAQMPQPIQQLQQIQMQQQQMSKTLGQLTPQIPVQNQLASQIGQPTPTIPAQIAQTPVGEATIPYPLFATTGTPIPDLFSPTSPFGIGGPFAMQSPAVPKPSEANVFK